MLSKSMLETLVIARIVPWVGKASLCCWGSWIRSGFGGGVGDLRDCSGVCYLRSWWGLSYLWNVRSWWVVHFGIMVGLIICRRWSLTGLVDMWKKRGARWRVLLMVGVPLCGVVDLSWCRLLQSFCVVLIHFFLVSTKTEQSLVRWSASLR
jgi:hypothetical protein